MAVTTPGGSGTMTLSATVYQATVTQAISRLLSGMGLSTVNLYTPPGLGGTGQSKPGSLNIETGTPRFDGETLKLQPSAQGVVLTGDTAGRDDARIVGHAGLELLAGNNADDTIKGGGGSGTIVSGSGHTLIHPGRGDFQIVSTGTDTIQGGSGVNQIEAYGSATVQGGTGCAVFVDDGGAGSHFKVKAGAGVTVATSGLGQDTFVGGSGTGIFKDGGGASVDFVFHAGIGGTDIIEGYRATDTITLAGFHAFGAGRITVFGGNSYLDLQGTKIEFVGVTNLTPGDFKV